MTVVFNGLKKLNNAIKSIAKIGLKYDSLIHDTGVQALLHAQACGDARPMDQLLKALGKSTRSKAFVLWVEEFSPIRWNGDGNVGVLAQTNKKYVPFQIEEAYETPFWALTEENPEVKALNLEALLKLIKGFVGKVEKADAEGNVYDKHGNLKYKVEGNVVTLKEKANKLLTSVAA